MRSGCLSPKGWPMSSQSCHDWPAEEPGEVVGLGDGAEGRERLLLRAVPAVEALGVLEVIVEPVRDVEVVGEDKHPAAEEPTARL